MRLGYYRLIIRTSFALLLLINVTIASAQFYENKKPLPDLSAGLKAVAGEFEHGPRYLETTAPFTPGFQPTIRYDYPFRLFTIRDNPFYLSITASTGFLYIPVKKQHYQFTDPYTRQTTEYEIKSPFYIPFSFAWRHLQNL